MAEQPAEPQVDTAHADVGIVHALPMEMAPLVARCERVRKTLAAGFVVRGGWLHGLRVAFVEVGVGERRVRRATRALIQGHTPALVVAAGFAGALSPALAVGDVVTAHEVVGPELPAPVQVPVKLPGEERSDGHPDTVGPPSFTGQVHVGRFLTLERIVRTAEEKRALAEQYQALAVDMETLPIAQTCQEAGVRFAAVRVVSDDAHHDLPPEVLTVLGSSRSFRIGAAVGAVWRRPGSVKDLWQLRGQAEQAAERLARYLAWAIPQLSPSLGPRTAEGPGQS